MRLAMIGVGTVGRTLGARLAEAGHTVRYGVRAPLADGGGGRFALPEAVHEAEVVILAVPALALDEVAGHLGSCEGLVVVDATNPIGPGPTLLRPGGTSGGEHVQRLLPRARVVKAFNTVGAEIMADPHFGPSAAMMPIAGDDATARARVAALAQDIGFEPLDFGGLSRAALLESLALAWMVAAGRLATREFGWGLLRRVRPAPGQRG